MNRTFNNGIGMVLMCTACDADALQAYFEAAGETAYRIGAVVERSKDEGAAVMLT